MSEQVKNKWASKNERAGEKLANSNKQAREQIKGQLYPMREQANIVRVHISLVLNEWASRSK